MSDHDRVVSRGGEDASCRAKHYARFHEGRFADADLEAAAAMVWVAEAVEDHPEAAWVVIAAAIETTDDPRALASIATSDLKVLINLHGLDFIDRIEAQHKHSERFRRALLSVTVVNPTVAERITQLQS